MLREVWHKFAKFFTDIREEREHCAQEIQTKRYAEIQNSQCMVSRSQIEDARRIVAEIEQRKKERIEKQFDSVHYQEFETVMEMVYVMQKAHYAQKRSAWSQEQKDEFNKKFNANLARCQKKLKFRRDYENYAEASERGMIDKPKTERDVLLNKILKEINSIDLASQPLVLDKDICLVQRQTRFKYEQALFENKKRKEQQAKRHSGKVISI